MAARYKFPAISLKITVHHLAAFCINRICLYLALSFNSPLFVFPLLCLLFQAKRVFFSHLSLKRYSGMVLFTWGFKAFPTWEAAVFLNDEGTRCSFSEVKITLQKNIPYEVSSAKGSRTFRESHVKMYIMESYLAALIQAPFSDVLL